MTDPVRFDPAETPQPQRCAAPPEGRVLCFSPHPDDEVLAVGGTLHLHALQEDPVRVVVATNGQTGDPEGRFAEVDYIERRQRESTKATGILGVRDLHFLGLPDSCVITQGDLLGLSLLVQQHLVEFKPDIVYAPWELDGNSDHMALHAAVVHALRETNFGGRAFGYEVWSVIPRPKLVVDITAVVESKRKALQHYATQLAYWDLVHFMDGLSSYRALMLPRNQGFAEAFDEIEF